MNKIATLKAPVLRLSQSDDCLFILKISGNSRHLIRPPEAPLPFLTPRNKNKGKELWGDHQVDLQGVSVNLHSEQEEVSLTMTWQN